MHRGCSGITGRAVNCRLVQQDHAAIPRTPGQFRAVRGHRHGRLGGLVVGPLGMDAGDRHAGEHPPGLVVAERHLIGAVDALLGEADRGCQVAVEKRHPRPQRR